MSSPVLIYGAPSLTASVPAQTGIGTTAAVIASASPKRKGFIIQNTGTTIIKLAFGSTLPTQTVYHVALKACTAADDGLGGICADDSWVGVIGAVSSAGGGTFVLTQFETGSPDWGQASDLGLR